MPKKTLKTANDFIQFTFQKFNKANLFFGHGTDNAWDEAVALVSFVLHLSYPISKTQLKNLVTEEEKEKILKLIQERMTTRKPLAYLTHEAYFAGLPFYVDERVLIPRSPIAELIESKFSPWIKKEAVKTILEIGTGSACIAIACAYAFPDAHIDAIDIDQTCLDVAAINIRTHHVEKHISLIKSNLFESIPQKKYDIIVSNPPYVDQQDMATLPAEYLHEPQHALRGGQDGLDLVDVILKNAENYLSAEGILIVEVGNSEEALIKKYPKHPFIWLEFERGGGGVFLLHQADVVEN